MEQGGEKKSSGASPKFTFSNARGPVMKETKETDEMTVIRFSVVIMAALQLLALAGWPICLHGSSCLVMSSNESLPKTATSPRG